MRLSFLTFTFILASGFALAADGPESVTYLEGNLDGLAVHSVATLELSHGKAMILRAKEAKVEIPYAGITKVERSTSKVETASEPLYKVWNLRKKLIPPTPVEHVTLHYKGQGSADHSVTLAMQKSSADNVMAAWDTENELRSKARGDWWGDGIWKTTRNKDQWGGSGQVAARE
ncbi:MAG: hypothetical protein ABI811_20755 [Acidobacteriota bacterium]